MEADRPRQAEIQIVRKTMMLRDRPFEYVVWIDRGAVGHIRMYDHVLEAGRV